MSAEQDAPPALNPTHPHSVDKQRALDDLQTKLKVVLDHPPRKSSTAVAREMLIVFGFLLVVGGGLAVVRVLWRLAGMIGQ